MIIQAWEKDAEAVEFEYMTAGGMNTPEQIDEMLADDDDPVFWANEVESNWTMHVSTNHLVDAIAEFILDRPDRA